MLLWENVRNEITRAMPPRRRRLTVLVRYAGLLLREFRWTLGLLLLVVALGGGLYAAAPASAFAESQPGRPWWPFLVAWMNLFGEPLVSPRAWYLAAVEALFPLIGFALVGEGVVRLGMLMFSRRHGEKEWMTVMASTFRNHIIICGLGHLGYRILGHLIARGEDIVALERDGGCPFLSNARDSGVAVLVRDMRDDEALRAAGIIHARVIIVASNDDLANIEVALDARRLNPGIRVLLRLFDQRIADKFKDAGLIDEAFSSAALAAPVVAAMVPAVVRRV
jgi:voltage-gated potassium channel